MNEPYCQSYWDWVNMARTDGWREISLAVHEDDLEGVPVVAGPLGAFYEKLSQLHLMKYHMAQPRNTVSGSTSFIFLLFLHISSYSSYFLIFPHISPYFLFPGY